MDAAAAARSDLEVQPCISPAGSMLHCLTMPLGGQRDTRCAASHLSAARSAWHAGAPGTPCPSILYAFPQTACSRATPRGLAARLRACTAMPTRPEPSCTRAGCTAGALQASGVQQRDRRRMQRRTLCCVGCWPAAWPHPKCERAPCSVEAGARRPPDAPSPQPQWRSQLAGLRETCLPPSHRHVMRLHVAAGGGVEARAWARALHSGRRCRGRRAVARASGTGHDHGAGGAR